MCEQENKLGDFHKRIQNIRFHLSSRGHVIKTEEHVSKIGGKKDMAALKVFDVIEKRFVKGVCLLKGVSVYCRCCDISINISSRGDPYKRVVDHVNTKGHVENQK